MKGVGIGNGLTDPEIQYKYYPQMAGYVSPTHWLVEKTYKFIESAVPGCIKSIKIAIPTKGAELSCFLRTKIAI